MPRATPAEPDLTAPRRRGRSAAPVEPVRKTRRLPKLPPQLTRWLWLLLILPAAYGVFLRLDAWWNTRVLRADEESIAYAAIAHGVRSWIDHGVDLRQSAPFGWLWMQRLLMEAGGINERLLHAPQLIADLAALALVTLVAARLMPLAGTFTVLTLAATNQWLIFYSYNVKQYSFEVLCAVLLVGTAIAVRRADDSRALAGWWGLAAVSLAFSQPAVFAVPAVAAVMAVEMVLRSQWTRLIAFASWSLLFWAALAADWYVSLRHSATNSYLRVYWQQLGAFPGKAGTSTTWVSQLVDHFAGNPLDATVAVAVLLAAVLGAVRLFWRRPFDALIVLAPLAAAAVVTILGIYPLWERAALWLVPGVVLLLGAAVDGARTADDSPRWVPEPDEEAGPWASPTRVAAAALGAVLVVSGMGFNVLSSASASASTQATLPAIRPMLDGVRARLQPGDVVLVDSWAEGWSRLYWSSFPGNPAVRGVLYLRPNDATCQSHPVQPLLAGAKRVWLMVVNNHSYRPYADAGLPGSLRAYGTVETAFRSGSQTAVYLLHPGPSTATDLGLPAYRSCLAQLPRPVGLPTPG
jgi:hypothetical protein